MSLPTGNYQLETNILRPGPEASILLSAYDLTAANTLFTSTLLSLSPSTKAYEAPISSFLSYTSYLLHHAYRSPRCALYGILSLSILRLILEDTSTAKLLTTPATTLSVRISRQVPPFLPPCPHPRAPTASLLDICIDSISHNLRLRLDCNLYQSTLNLLHRILTHLSSTRTRLPYHWSLLWQTLFSLLRFLTTYASSLTTQNSPENIHHLLTPLLCSLALAVSEGESFLPEAESYDDLFYKLVEAGSILPKFKTAFFTPPPPPSYSSSSSLSTSTETASYKTASTAAITTLLHVVNHYHTLLATEKEKGRLGKTLEPREVGRVIRSGLETLDLPPPAGDASAALNSAFINASASATSGSASGSGTGSLFRAWTKWREGEERGFLKRVARAAVEDARRVVGGR